MAQPSTFTHSIKFYDRMSQLQGDLSAYQTQQFQLEEEFGRLCQGQGVGARPSSSTQVQEEGRRRARNQAILDKLQQLEGNVSIFAARSERLRLMKNEYESLVRKYGNQFQGKSVHFNEINPTPSASVGVNTEISGPVLSVNEIPVAESRSRLTNIDTDAASASAPLPPFAPSQPPAPPERDQDDANSNTLPTLPPFLPVARVPSFLDSSEVPVKSKPTFLDISSSSSEDGEEKKEKKEQRVEELEEESSTSVSALMPKAARSNHFNMRSISSEGSVSESTSKIQIHPPKRNPIRTATTILPSSEETERKEAEEESFTNDNENDNTSRSVGESLDNRAEFGELNDSEIVENLADNEENANHAKRRKSLTFQDDQERSRGELVASLPESDKPERDVEGTGQSSHNVPAKENVVEQTKIHHRLWEGEEESGAEVGRHIQFGSKEESGESSSKDKSPPKIMKPSLKKRESGAVDPGKASAGRKLNLKLNYDDSESENSEKVQEGRGKADEERKKQVESRGKKDEEDSLDEFFGF